MRKLFSLTGVVPIGVFLVGHLATYSSALLGRDELDRALERARSPYALVWEALLIWLPLAFHAGYGIKVAFEGKSNATSYPYARNWAYLMQRLSGIVALAFIVVHVWQLRLPLLLGKLDRSEVFAELCASLSSTGIGGVPLLALFYLVGIAATVFHFANGLNGFCFSWGIATTRAGLKRVSAVTGLVGVVLFAVGANSVVYFATGSRLTLTLTNAGGGPPALTCQDVIEETGQTAAPAHRPTSGPLARNGAR
jgi:succinate dehydrogenase / fumarate reductase cytochrome b subunit